MSVLTDIEDSTIAKISAARRPGIESVVASGFGDASYNDTYALAGIYNGQSKFVGNVGRRIIYFDAGYAGYVLNGAIASDGDPTAYALSPAGTTPAGGPWSIIGGTGPGGTTVHLTLPPFFNKVDVYRGEKDEVFKAVARESAPSCWLFFHRGINKAPEFPTTNSMGLPQMEGTLMNQEALVWSLLLCARSLRATREVSQGGPGVIGAYDQMELVIGPPGSPATTLGQVRGFRPSYTVGGKTLYAEPFVLVGREMLGQTTTEVVYEVQMRTRVQL